MHSRRHILQGIMGLVLTVILLNISRTQVTACCHSIEFPFNDQGKVYYETRIPLIIDQQNGFWSVEKDLVRKMKVDFPKGIRNFKLNENEQIISLNHVFLIYKKSILSSQIDGAISVQIVFSMQGDNALVTFSNLAYQEYGRNRYGQFRPRTSGFIEIENYINKRLSKKWEDRSIKIDQKIRELQKYIQSSLKIEPYINNENITE